jgi:hypothetical protein
MRPPALINNAVFIGLFLELLSSMLPIPYNPGENMVISLLE